MLMMMGLVGADAAIFLRQKKRCLKRRKTIFFLIVIA
jgi:hypothetical protein